MSSIIPFVTVDNAKDAIEFYKEVFGAEVQGEITWLKNVPGYDRPEFENKVGHSTLKIGDSIFFLNDAIDESPLQKGERIQFVLDLKTENDLKKVFSQLKEEGKVVSELQEVFWGALFGVVKDKFDVTWQIYYGHK